MIAKAVSNETVQKGDKLRVDKLKEGERDRESKRVNRRE